MANYVHDNIEGIAADNYIAGTFGSDPNITGTDARDFIVGRQGADTITGGKGADIMYGGERTFYVPIGDAGNTFPTYYGDNQADTFVFHKGDSGMGAGNRDIIRGFDVGKDKIDLTSLGADLHYSYFVTAGKVMLNIDSDHNGKWDMQISVITSHLHDPSTFSSADLILI